MIRIDKARSLFTLHTVHSTYLMQADATGRMLHLYYGPRTEDLPMIRSPHNDPGCHPNLLPQEWPCPGMGDNHAPFFEPEFADGTAACALRYSSSHITPGLPSLPGLPAFQGEGETLSLILRDDAGLTVELNYAVAEECDLILRWATLTNSGTRPLTLRGVPSAVLDFRDPDLDFITLDGEWAAERAPHRAALRPGVQSVSSVCGLSSHFHNPFAVLCEPGTGEEQGACWGAALVYSGNFRIQTEQTRDGARLSLGIEPYHFAWTLAPGERFTTPQAAFVFSDRGLGGMSRAFHDAIRTRLIQGRWRDMAAPRPVLLNSWEACYFTFDETGLLALAAAAKQAGADLFVLDDGWFKGRDDDSTSLGDWVADSRKLPGGIPALCRKVNEMGLDLGIWVEPEAVSPGSDLFRAHPDWALQIPGRDTLKIRNQYTLDFSCAEVREAIWQQMTALLDSCPIRYLKWDMNRTLANVYSTALPAARQGEVYHRYVLGVYDLQEKLIARYPDLLLENCAGGGARFDCGMLYYAPQIWCSDNTDALDRLTIQYGTSLCYPPCVMGAHFSTVPNHITGRNASVEARMAAALSGTFGYELDLTKYSEADRTALKPWSDFAREHGALLRGGELYRIVPPTGGGAAWAIAAKDGSEAVVFAVGDVADGRRLPLPFADPASCYRVQPVPGGDFTTCTAAMGLPMPALTGVLPGCIFYLRAG